MNKIKEMLKSESRCRDHVLHARPHRSNYRSMPDGAWNPETYYRQFVCSNKG